MIRREKVESNSEFIIISYMIMDKEVLSSSFRRYKSGELKTRHFTKDFQRIFRWLIRYYSKHKKPPKKTIQNLYEKYKKNINKENQEIIEEYLDRVAEEYINYQDENIDPEFVKKEILPDFMRERELSERIERAQIKLDTGKYNEAEKIISTYAKVNDEEEEKDLGIIIPYTSKDVKKELSEKKQEKNIVYRFDGDLGRLIGPLQKSWLVAITGIEKSGKSYVLQEIGYDAALYQNQKVLHISLELSKTLSRNRAWRRISTTGNRRDPKFIYPIFDCENNQFNICRKKKKKPKNKKPLFRSSDEIVSYFERKKWTICDDCRFDKKIRKNAAKRKRFVPTIWFDDMRIRKVTKKRVIKSIHENRMMRLSNYRVKCFPRYSVTFDEVYEYILRYIDKTGWKPTIILFDYIDILDKEPENLQERIDVDRKWKKASKLAGELNCLVFNADQATKASRTQYALDKMSTSESKTKDAHLDLRIALNKTDDEGDLGIARMGVIFHRHEEFNVKREVLLTQRLTTSQPILDNVRIFDRGKKYRVVKSKF